MMLKEITPLILTYNEAPNIERTLHKLEWATRIVIIDSYSTDATLDILKSYSKVDIFYRKFDTFANQCNYGLDYINSEWVLSIDADYIVTDSLIEELNSLSQNNSLDGYFVKFKYCIFGKPLRGTILPPRQVLFKKDKGHYIDDGHAHKVIVNGNSGNLKSYIYHDDRKPLNRWLASQGKYMIIERQKIIELSNKKISFADKIRKQKILAPFIVFVYCLIFKGGILDGWAGWYYAFQRTLAEILLSIYLIEQDVKS